MDHTQTSVSYLEAIRKSTKDNSGKMTSLNQVDSLIKTLIKIKTKTDFTMTPQYFIINGLLFLSIA